MREVEAAITALLEGTLLDRVVVLAECGSTQDEALRLASGRPGLMVVALRQTAGRGRLGRSWTHHEASALACTMVLGGDIELGRLSMAAGLASCRVCERALRGDAALVGLRWPNDVVERGGGVQGHGRKLAGVLVERRGGVSLVGVGMNLSQRGSEWGELEGRACSLAELGGKVLSVAEAAGMMAFEMTTALALEEESLGAQWRVRDTLRGTRREFMHDGARFIGVVRDIEPRNFVLLELSDGSVVRLPAMTTSLVPE